MMIIRPFEQKDYARLLQLLTNHIPEYFAPAELEDYKSYLVNGREDYFVIEVDGMLVAGGGINYFPKELKARIAWDVVSEECLGTGIGSILVAHRVAHIRQHSNAREVIVRTSQLAYRFYAKQGFELLQTRGDFWAPGYDLYEMRLIL